MRSPAPTALPQHARAFLFALASVSLVGGLAGFGARIDTPQPVPLVACWVDHLRTPLVPDDVAAAADRDAIAASPALEVDPVHLKGGMTAELVSERLRLDAVGQDSPCVVYLSAYATCDADGGPLLIAEDYDPLTTGGTTPLAAVLDTLDARPGPVLLVLNLDWGLADAGAGLAPCGVGQKVLQTLEARPGRRRLTLLACSPGERPAALPGGGRTTLGYFFEAGLTGAADGYNTGRLTDARVDASELCQYVADRVADWSRRHGAAAQTPLVIGGREGDFVLSRVSPAAVTIATPPTEYPDWLASGWADHDAWLAGDVNRAAPRVVRRWGLALADAERRWRAGADPTRLAEWFAKQTASLRREVTEIGNQAARTPVVTLAQRERRVGAPPAELVAVWSAWLDSIGLPAEAEAAAALDKAVASADPDTVAAAAVSALRTHGAGFRVALRATRERLDKLRLETLWVEIGVLHALDTLAPQRPLTPDAELAEFFETALAGHDLRADPRAGAWVGGSLDTADRDWRTAWAMLASPGYASVDAAVRSARQARDGYDAASAHWRAVEAAIAARDAAMRVAPDVAPLAQASPLSLQNWTDTTAAAARLATRLESPDHSPTRRTAEWFKSVGAEAEALRNKIARLTRPLDDDAIDELVTSIHNDPTPGAIAQGERLLACPLIASAKRVELVLALNAAATASLADLPAFAAKPLSPGGAAGTTARLDAVNHSEAERLAALLELAGVRPDAVEALRKTASTDADPIAVLRAIRAAGGAATDQAHGGASITQLDRFARVFPVGQYDPVFDRVGQSPSLSLMSEQRRQSAARYAVRLLSESHDVGGIDCFVEASRRLGGDATERRLTADSDALRLASISRHSPADYLAAPLRVGSRGPVRVDAFQPTGCLEMQCDYDPSAAELTVRARLSPEATVAQIAATEGVLLRFTTPDRIEHLRVATPGLASEPPIACYVDVAGLRLPLDGVTQLPPLATPAPLRLVAVNQTERAIHADARVEAGAPYTATVDLPPLGEAPLTLTPVDPPDPTAPAKTVQRLDASFLDSDGKTIAAHQAVLRVADPIAYVRVHDARLSTSRHGLTSASVHVQRLDGAPDTATVDVAIRGAGGEPLANVGTLSATLTAEHPAAVLRADLGPSAAVGDRVTAEMAVSGVEATLRWAAAAPSPAIATAMPRVTAPSVRIDAPAMVAAGSPLEYAIDVTPSIADAQVLVELRGAATSDASRSYAAARRSVVTVAGAPAGGGLLVAARLDAWRDSFDTTGLSGERLLVAAVLDAAGQTLAESALPIVIDADPADTLAVSVDGSAVAGKPLKLRVAARDRLSGVSQVRLYAGAPDASLAPPKGAAVAVAVESPGAAGEWLGALPTPADAPAAIVTAEVNNGVGLVRRETLRLPLADAQQAALGQVTGAVVEGARPQPGVDVELVGADKQPIAKAKTDRKGAFVFDAVKPGKYFVTAVKPATQRVGAQPVDVKAGAVTSAQVSLSL